MTSSVEVIQMYRAAVVYMREQNMPVPSVLEIADWQGSTWTKRHHRWQIIKIFRHIVVLAVYTILLWLLWKEFHQ